MDVSFTVETAKSSGLVVISWMDLTHRRKLFTNIMAVFFTGTHSAPTRMTKYLLETLPCAKRTNNFKFVWNILPLGNSTLKLNGRVNGGKTVKMKISVSF